MPEITDRTGVRRILEESRVIAVLGAHDEPHRPAFYVPDYLAEMGYRVIPVNPLLVGDRLWGETVRSNLASIREPIDMVDVFRRAESLMGHVDDILAMSPRPRVVWLQLGIRNDAFTRRLVEAGIAVVQSRCTMADPRGMGLSAVRA